MKLAIYVQQCIYHNILQTQDKIQISDLDPLSQGYLVTPTITTVTNKVISYTYQNHVGNHSLDGLDHSN